METIFIEEMAEGFLKKLDDEEQEVKRRLTQD